MPMSSGALQKEGRHHGREFRFVVVKVGRVAILQDRCTARNGFDNVVRFPKCFVGINFDFQRPLRGLLDPAAEVLPHRETGVLRTDHQVHPQQGRRLRAQDRWRRKTGGHRSTAQGKRLEKFFPCYCHVVPPDTPCGAPSLMVSSLHRLVRLTDTSHRSNFTHHTSCMILRLVKLFLSASSPSSIFRKLYPPVMSGSGGQYPPLGNSQFG